MDCMFYVCGGSGSYADEISEITGIKPQSGPPKGNGLALVLDESGLSLRSGSLSYKGDFGALLKRTDKSRIGSEPLVKAMKTGGKNVPLTVADATAGMGEDSFLLASAGHRVLLFERDRIIGALLYDALKRAEKQQETAGAVSRMKLFVGDSTVLLPEMSEKIDAVLLDPMFPQRQKSGLIKKKFQLLQQLESPCTDENVLLEAAISAGPSKIVINRPQNGPFLGGKKPSWSINGSVIRYDCIVLKS